MTKELNFNKADIEAENMAFYEWQESLKADKYKTWHGYFLKGGNSTYIGIISGKAQYQFKFKDVDFAEARRHIKFKHFRTNLDDGLTVFDKAILSDCRKLAENRWREDCGLDYQVTSQVTSQVKEQGR